MMRRANEAPALLADRERSVDEAVDGQSVEPNNVITAGQLRAYEKGSAGGKSRLGKVEVPSVGVKSIEGAVVELGAAVQRVQSSLATAIVARDGDTYWDLSKKHFGSGEYWSAIAIASGSSGDEIAVGQELLIPASNSFDRNAASRIGAEFIQQKERIAERERVMQEAAVVLSWEPIDSPDCTPENPFGLTYQERAAVRALYHGDTGHGISRDHLSLGQRDYLETRYPIEVEREAALASGPQMRGLTNEDLRNQWLREEQLRRISNPGSFEQQVARALPVAAGEVVFTALVDRGLSKIARFVRYADDAFAPIPFGGPSRPLARGSLTDAPASLSFSRHGEPGVAQLVAAIELRAPGTVRAVNLKFNHPRTNVPLAEWDIVTDSAVIQVKTGPGRGLTKQLVRTREQTHLDVIAYDANALIGRSDKC